MELSAARVPSSFTLIFRLVQINCYTFFSADESEADGKMQRSPFRRGVIVVILFC